jgi:excisionase family DNA binding protein
MTIQQATKATGLSRATIYSALKEKKLAALKCGKRTLILHGSLVAFLGSLPAYKSGA